MRETLSLGRIAGVRVGVHWSLLVIVVLVAITLARSRLPDGHPGRPAALYWTLALLTAVAFLASLLAHELAHAVVARRNGVQVDGITLWMLGGVAKDVMHPLSDVATAAPDEPAVDLLPRLEATSTRRALVLDDGRLVGIVTLADVSRSLTWPTRTAGPQP